MSQPTLNDATTNPHDNDSDIQTLHQTLTTQATTLLSELTAFHKHLSNLATTTPNPLITRPDTLLGKFQVDVRREVDHLLKYGGPGDGTNETGDGGGDADGEVDLDGIHRIRSSNITFLADVWDGIKGATGVVGVRKGVRYYPRSASSSGDSVTKSSGAAVRLSASGDVTDGVKGGVKGVSKKMNREARERVKRERRLQSQDQNQNSTNGDENGSGDVRHESSTQTPDGQPTPLKKTRGRLNTTTNGPPSRKDKENVTVDIISDHGATWIKMFTKNERWLMMDLAKEGIVDIDEDDSDDVEEGLQGPIPTDTREGRDVEAMEELKLVKMAREFMAAARTTRVGRDHRHPRVKFHLPKIRRGFSKDVDRVLGYMGRIGVDVVTAEEATGPQENSREKNGDRSASGKNGFEKHECNLQETFERMARPLPSVPITETLNVDCTILIALISDVSSLRKADIEIPQHYKGTARRDIEVQLQTDIEDPLLPNHIYPILRGRRLVCTRKATEHWKNIVRIMGSPTEAERCRIFLGEATGDDSQGLSARERLQKLSVHEVPEDLQLPFEVVDFDLDDMNIDACDTNCRQVEIDVMRELANEPRLSSLNSSVFFHGWYKGMTTVSLNRVVSEWLNRAINVILDDLETKAGMTSDIAQVVGFSGANVLICGRERSLLGSEK